MYIQESCDQKTWQLSFPASVVKQEKGQECPLVSSCSEGINGDLNQIIMKCFFSPSTLILSLFWQVVWEQGKTLLLMKTYSVYGDDKYILQYCTTCCTTETYHMSQYHRVGRLYMQGQRGHAIYANTNKFPKICKTANL